LNAEPNGVSTGKEKGQLNSLRERTSLVSPGSISFFMLSSAKGFGMTRPPRVAVRTWNLHLQWEFSHLIIALTATALRI